MSSKRRSYDTDEITLRKVFAKSVIDNTNIGALKVLTADGAGGTYWTLPSTNGSYNPSFNRIVTTAGTFTADLSYNTFTLTQGAGVGFTQGEGDNQLFIFGKGFTQIDIEGNNTISAFESNVLDPIVRFEATGGLNIRGDPVTNTITFDVQGNQISSGQFTFQKAKILNTSTVTEGVSSLSSFIILNANDFSSILTFVGIGDIELSTNYATNSIFIGLDISTGTVSSLVGQFNLLSTTYTQLTDFSTAAIGLSVSQNKYTLSSIFDFTTLTLQNSISSIAFDYTPLTALFSTSEGINNRISTFDIISSVSTVNIYGGTVTDFSASIVNVYQGDLSSFSTTTGDVIFGILSSISTLNNVSTLALSGLSSLSTAITTVIKENIPSTVTGLGLIGYVSTSGLVSTVVGLGTYGYVSTSGLVSSVIGLGTYGYVSTSGLVSTVIGLGTYGYVSTSGLVSTVIGLGTYGYISTPGLVSTVEGLGTYGYISTPSLVSTVAGLGQASYISSGQFLSSFQGLSNIAVTRLNAGTNITLTQNIGDITINSSGGGGGVTTLSTSFTSTIAYQGFNGSLNAQVVNQRSFYFSTADVYLDKFSSYIRSTSRILVDFNYNLRLSYYGIILSPGFTDTNTNRGIIFFSTLLMYNNSPDPGSVLEDNFNASYFGGSVEYGSNCITRRQQFQARTIDVISAYTKPVQLYHRFDNALYTSNTVPPSSFFGGLNNSTVIVKYSSTNSVFVTIQN